jgi:two-component system sensor histidine kinase PilS (NtrC family)
MKDPDSSAALRHKLARLIGARLITVTALLGTGVLVEMVSPGTFPGDPFFILIAVTYGLSFVYALTHGATARRRWLVDVQLGLDAAVVTAFIYLTGGVTSYFSSLYVLPIIAATILQLRRGGLLLAVLNTLTYGGLVLAQYLSSAGLLSPLWIRYTAAALPPQRVAVYTFAINAFGFFAVALLSGSLAEGLQRADDRLERASHEIADWQAFNQHVIDSLMSGLATTDRSGRIRTFNRGAETITAQAAAAVIGRSIADVLQLPPDLARALDQDLEGARGKRADFTYHRPDGRAIDIGLSATYLDTPGGRAGYLFSFQDVTNFKKLERDARMQQRLAAVGEMAAGIAHEIRNPLASMSGSIQILRQELPLSTEQAQLMDIVLRESERLNHTIRSFLAYARPQRFSMARLDVRRVLNDTAVLLRHSAEVHDGHSIDVAVPPDAVWYEADEGQLRQIVWNLATNGLRSMERGGRLLLSARLESPFDRGKNPAVVIEVADEGIGIAPEDLEGIFQPFHGAFPRGSGLGLSIVHRIVSDYNGDIRVNSALGQGTRVTVRFPLRTAAVAVS